MLYLLLQRFLLEKIRRKKLKNRQFVEKINFLHGTDERQIINVILAFVLIK